MQLSSVHKIDVLEAKRRRQFLKKSVSKIDMKKQIIRTNGNDNNSMVSPRGQGKIGLRSSIALFENFMKGEPTNNNNTFSKARTTPIDEVRFSNNDVLSKLDASPSQNNEQNSTSEPISKHLSGEDIKVKPDAKTLSAKQKSYRRSADVKAQLKPVFQGTTLKSPSGEIKKKKKSKKIGKIKQSSKEKLIDDAMRDSSELSSPGRSSNSSNEDVKKRKKSKKKKADHTSSTPVLRASRSNTVIGKCPTIEDEKDREDLLGSLALVRGDENFLDDDKKKKKRKRRKSSGRQLETKLEVRSSSSSKVQSDDTLQSSQKLQNSQKEEEKALPKEIPKEEEKPKEEEEEIKNQEEQNPIIEEKQQQEQQEEEEEEKNKISEDTNDQSTNQNQPPILGTLNLEITKKEMTTSQQLPITPGRSPRNPGHKRHLSSEDISGGSITPRSENIDIMSQPIILPICSLPGSQEWENKKIKQMEKYSKQKLKEEESNDQESKQILLKLDQDVQTHIIQLQQKQQQERKQFQKKIQVDKTALSERQTTEKKQLDKALLKEKEEAKLKLQNEHDANEKQKKGEFEKQILLVKKANKDAEDTGEALIDHLKFAHNADMNRESHKQVLNQLQLLHKHEYEKLKKKQEIEKRHVQQIQQLERDVLMQQLSLTQKQLRQKRWMILDDLRLNENTKYQILEKKHQMEMRHENQSQENAFKLLMKQHQMEKGYIGKNLQTHHKQGNALHQKQKKSLKSNYQSNVRKLRADKSLAKDDLRIKIEELKNQFDNSMEQLDELLSTKQVSNVQDQALQVRHDNQISTFKANRRARRDALLLIHQNEKNLLQASLDDDRKDVELKMKHDIENFQIEESEMKIAFNDANETNLWSLQQRHWLESGNLQKHNHEEQQRFIDNIKSELEVKFPPKRKLEKSKTLDEKPLDSSNSTKGNDDKNLVDDDQKNLHSDDSDDSDDDDDSIDDEELSRRLETQARIQREQKELQAQLEKQLEEQQEAEKLQLEQERAKEQENLRLRLEEEKKEVMETKIQEDEDSLRQEYIRKIARDTGLSEELIAAQLDRIGMPSYMF